LSQKVLPDEIIIVDDNSNDKTVIIAEKILSKSSVNYLIKKNKFRLGINRSFEKCFSLASFDIIIISDQDDYWFSDRIKNIKLCFSKNDTKEILLVNSYVKTKDDISAKNLISDYYPYTRSFIVNFFKNRFIGCQMAVKSSYLKNFYPFPNDYICYYDHWLSLFSLLRKTTIYIDSPQGYYYRHYGNVTNLLSPRSFNRIVLGRFILFFKFVKKYFLFISCKNKK
jgi:glycosyltransferase involved in cell wall biosynthesis